MTRRELIAMAGTAFAASRAGVADADAAVPSHSQVGPVVPTRPANTVPVGLQMFSLRAEEQQDRLATLTAVAKMGYQGVEFYAPYYDWTPAYAKTVRAHLDSVGLRCFSNHTNRAHFTAAHLSKVADLNSILGSRHVVMAHSVEVTGEQDGWKKLAAELTTAHETLKKYGLSAGFHNWPDEFKTIDGYRPIDVLIANTPADLGFQIDTYGPFHHGADLVAFLHQHRNRVRSYHLKDWAATRNRLILGEGDVKWPPIFEAAERVGGVEYYLIEQEGSRLTPMETARIGLEQYRRLRA